MKNERLLVSLGRNRFDNALSATAKDIVNFLDYELSDTGSFVLLHGLNFRLPPRYLCKEEIFAKFESLLAQVLHHSATSVEQRTALKTQHAYLGHIYCNNTIGTRDFKIRRVLSCNQQLTKE